MMTQTSSRSRMISIWVLFVAALCLVMAPSTAIAKKEMTIALEGDPGDGLGASGGGSGFISTIDNSGQANSGVGLNWPTFDLFKFQIWEGSNGVEPGTVLLIPILLDGNLQFQVIYWDKFLPEAN